MYHRPQANNFDAQCVVQFENRAPCVGTLCGYWPTGPGTPRADWPTMSKQISAKCVSGVELDPDSAVALQLVVCGVTHHLTCVIPTNEKLGMRKTLFCKPKIGASFVKVSVKRTPQGIRFVGITITNPQTFPGFQERFAELMRAETLTTQRLELEAKQRELRAELDNWPAKVQKHEATVQFLKESILELSRLMVEPDCGDAQAAV